MENNGPGGGLGGGAAAQQLLHDGPLGAMQCKEQRADGEHALRLAVQAGPGRDVSGGGGWGVPRWWWA